MMASKWPERVGSFCSGPSSFLSGTNPEVFLSELLRELRDDRASSSIKVVLLSPLCEYPTLLCPSDPAGEETALDLMSVFTQCPPTCTQFRCQLLVTLTCVLICSSCVSKRSQVSLDFLDLVLQVAQDTGDISSTSPQRSLRATACDCLRDLETCCPGLLSQRLELLGGLRQQETSRLHQVYTGLQTVALRNAVYHLSQEPGAGAEHLKAVLGGNTSAMWEADQDSFQMEGKDWPGLASLVLGPMGSVPTLHTGADCKELKLVLSSLLEESYLLTPLYQAALLHRVTEVVAMVPGVPPAILRAQLLRLLGTSEVCLFHVALLMKGAFTDSLFSAEDEAFLLKRLVVLSQHPVLSTPEKLFYLDCILHFPENRPISCGDGEALPVLLTPQLASAVLPTVFNDGGTLLARLRLLSLVYLEEGDVGGEGLAYLYGQLMSLLRVVASGGSREIVVTFFRAAFLVLFYFSHMEQFCSGLSRQLCQLYLQHPQLAPHIINMANRTQERLPESGWALGLLRGLQKVITEARLTLRDLGWHLKVLARVAEEAEISQRRTLTILTSIITSSLCARGDWRLGNGLLGVCRRLLLHPTVDSLLVALADILQHLVCHYGDTDIQDHARLYFTLLTTLSQEKLAAMLEQGPTEGERQVKKRTLSCLMAESEGLTSMLTVHRTDKPILCLTEAPEQLEESKSCDSNQNELNEALETYRAQFADPHFASEVTLKYQLTHTEASEPGFDQIFSICLHFSLTDHHYEQLEDISVPCLFRDRPPPVVQLRLKPRQPYPTSLHVSAMFTTREGLTWHTHLPQVHVVFQQVFMPLPAPPSWAPGSRLKVFQKLWDEISTETGDAAVSLFCCQLTGAALNALLKKHLLPFLLPGPSGQEESKVLIYLPSQNHLLLRIRAEEDAVHFDIATENWQLLPHVNSYLLSITS